MASSLDVARYFLKLAAPSQDEDVDCLSHLRLQKLLYYAQGWHLASRGMPLFSGRIEAWTHGPVVREVYPAFRKFGYCSIPPSEGSESSELTEQDKGFIRSVWEEYKQYSASALRAMTHQEQPWQDARTGLGPTERTENEISAESLKAFFSGQRLRQLPHIDPRIDVEKWAQTATAIAEGRTKTTQEIRRELEHRRSRPHPG